MAERKRSKEDRDIINSFKIFARFNTPQDHEKMVNNLVRER
jgi:transcriptional adapter 2-alpha